jgi:hypothetical protein
MPNRADNSCTTVAMGGSSCSQLVRSTVPECAAAGPAPAPVCSDTVALLPITALAAAAAAAGGGCAAPVAVTSEALPQPCS